MRTALITGASKSIGLATANALAECGMSVILFARSEAVEAAAAQLREAGYDATAVRGDVSNFADTERAVAAAGEGGLDVLVNNAGTIDPIAHIGDADPAAWADAIAVNLVGPFNAMRAVLPVMAEAGQGTVVNISSGAANSALEGWSHYCATKAGVQKLTAIGHKEYGERGINIVGLSPGTVATDMMRTIRDSGINPVSQLDWETHIPPEDAARAVVYLIEGGAAKHAGADFSIKTPEGRAEAGLPPLST